MVRLIPNVLRYMYISIVIILTNFYDGVYICIYRFAIILNRKLVEINRNMHPAVKDAPIGVCLTSTVCIYDTHREASKCQNEYNS